MKKIFLLLILLFLITFSLFSQKNNVRFGINLGGTYSSIEGNGFANKNSSDLDYLVGISLKYQLNETFSLLGNINYENNMVFYDQIVRYDENGNLVIYGCPIENPNCAPTFKIATKFQYLTLPVLIRYNFNEFFTGFFMNGGVFFSYLINVANYIDSKKNDLDFNDLFKKFNSGLSLGLGYQIIINKKTKLNLELRDNFGIINISDSNLLGSSIKNNSINLIANINFNL